MTFRTASGTDSRSRCRGTTAFTLIEVMIAMAIFFMAVFAILELVASNLRNARLLETPRVDCGLVIADLVQTNQLEEGTQDVDLDKVFPGYHCEQDIVAADDVVPLGDTNGLFHVWYVLKHPDGTIETNLQALVWKPDSKPVHGP
ncbi:MAG TPA: prepilin-type N-terminal cleavage/methylation domain-containing protein [Verrucomicrobiae bacterium]|nr:prepilin-type N-terminal cleavage/methylation domain-containing protein [Verrucomicrobiae bacterium]